MNTHVKHCSRLNDKSFDTILIGDSLIAGLARYSKVWNKFFKPLNAFNCGIGGDRVEHVLRRAHDLRCFSSLRNVIILCGTNNLYHDSPEDIANGLIKIASCFKQGNDAICNALIQPHFDYACSVRYPNLSKKLKQNSNHSKQVYAFLPTVR